MPRGTLFGHVVLDFQAGSVNVGLQAAVLVVALCGLWCCELKEPASYPLPERPLVVNVKVDVKAEPAPAVPPPCVTLAE